MKWYRLALLLFWAFSFVAPNIAWSQSCPSRTSLDELQANLDQAETAFIELDAALFSKSLEDLSIKLPCVRDLIPKSLAARYHRVWGIHQFSQGDELQAFQTLQAARVLEPGYTFPEGMFPSNHTLVVQYQRLKIKPRSSGRVANPRNLEIYFDGEKTRQRPAGQSTLLQISSKSGEIRTTEFLPIASPMPNYEATQRLRKPLAIGTSAAAVLAGVFLGASAFSRAQFNADDPNYTLDDLERLKRNTNTLAGVSIAFASITVIGGTSIIAVGDR